MPMPLRFTMLIFAAWLVAAPAQAYEALTFAQAVDALDPAKNTSFAIKTWFQGNRGTPVEWRGRVVDVEGKAGKVRVVMANDERPTYKGYNLQLMLYGDTSPAAALKVGQKIRFLGQLTDYKPIQTGGAILYVTEGRILP